MSDITSNLCRLCLKESFTLHNIYSSHTTSGDLVYRVLNYVYDLEITPDDDLLTQICAPCMWKMLEFEGYKRNIHSARVEIAKLLSKLRHGSTGGCGSREFADRPIESDSAQEVLPREDIEPRQEEGELFTEILVEKQGSMPEHMKEYKGKVGRRFRQLQPIFLLEFSQIIRDGEILLRRIIFSGEEPRQEDIDLTVDEEDGNQWETSEFDTSKSSKATPKAVNVETPEGNKAVVQPAVATPPSTRSTIMNKVSGEGLVADEGPKESKHLRFSGKSSQCESNPPSPRKTRTVEVEKPSCDNSKQGPSSEKDRTQQSMSEHQSGAEIKVTRPFVCQQCGASYVRKHFLEKHEVAHRKESTYTTSGQRLRSKRDLNSQKQFHSHVLPYSTRSSELKNFQSLDASEETARNSLEGKSSSVCTSRYNAIEISDANKTINGKDLSVDVVPKEETPELSRSILNDTKSELSYLKAPVSKRKSGYICDICKKSFKCKQNLGNHLRVHNDERPFSCNVCDKTFRQDNARYIHELRHMRDKMRFGKSENENKEKQFSCTVCGKHFSSKNGLHKHSNLHGDKYKCNSCGRRFEGSFHLSNHSRTHTKEKPFKCEVCLKRFSIKCNLKTHLRTHSSEKPFSCEICDNRFKSKREKTEHELLHLRKK